MFYIDLFIVQISSQNCWLPEDAFFIRWNILQEIKHLNIYTSVSQPFLTRGTLNIRKKLTAHWYQEIFEKDQVKSLYCIPNTFFSPKRIVKLKTNKLAAHLEAARGTPVEKHWSTLCWLLSFVSFNILTFLRADFTNVDLKSLFYAYASHDACKSSL